MINLVTSFLTRGYRHSEAMKDLREFAHIEFKYETLEYVAHLLNTGQIYKNNIDNNVN